MSELNEGRKITIWYAVYQKLKLEQFEQNKTQ